MHGAQGHLPAGRRRPIQQGVIRTAWSSVAPAAIAEPTRVDDQDLMSGAQHAAQQGGVRVPTDDYIRIHTGQELAHSVLALNPGGAILTRPRQKRQEWVAGHAVHDQQILHTSA